MARERVLHETAVSIWRVTCVTDEPVAESGNFTKYPLFLGGCVVTLCMPCVSRE